MTVFVPTSGFFLCLGTPSTRCGCAGASSMVSRTCTTGQSVRTVYTTVNLTTAWRMPELCQAAVLPRSRAGTRIAAGTHSHSKLQQRTEHCRWHNGPTHWRWRCGHCCVARRHRVDDLLVDRPQLVPLLQRHTEIVAKSCVPVRNHGLRRLNTVSVCSVSGLHPQQGQAGCTGRSELYGLS